MHALRQAQTPYMRQVSLLQRRLDTILFACVPSGRTLRRRSGFGVQPNTIVIECNVFIESSILKAATDGTCVGLIYLVKYHCH